MVDTLSLDSYKAQSADSKTLAIDAETMFSDHQGTHKPRIEKRQRKLLDKIAFLAPFLEEGERVLTITTAVSPTSFLEQWTTGFIFVYLRRCLLVFTDRRIFHVPTTSGFEYRESVAQIRYGDVKSIAQKGSRLKIAYKKGDKDLFLYVRGSERKKIRALLNVADLAAEPTTVGKRVHLCPQCTTQLEADRYDCPGCGKPFKDRRKARNLSIWLPGGGYFYTGHPFLGISDAVIELLFLLLIVASLVPNSISPNGDPATAIFFGVFLFIEKVVTIYHANHFIKEYLPVDPKPRRRSVIRLGINSVGVVVLLGLLAFAVLGILSDTGQVPSERVLNAQDVSGNHYDVLLAEGIIEQGEMIEYFYSEGFLSIKEGGSILTNYRVIAYEQNEHGQIDSYYIPNDEIAAVTLVQQGDAMNFSIYQVSGPGEQSWIYLLLPHEYGDGERFANAVRGKIRQPQ